MQIENLNLNNLRVFESVFQNRCMTKAAHNLHLTQSGVSQHIKALEESLEVQLFDRVNRKLIPTEAGRDLFEKIHSALGIIDEAVKRATHKEGQIEGEVRIGMPIEFGNSLLVPHLTQIGLKHPGLKFALRMDYASVMNRAILDGEIDFAFVDEYPMDPGILTEKVGEEVLELCTTLSYLRAFGSPKNEKAYFEGLDYVEYQKEEPILRAWMGHHLQRRNLTLNLRAWVMDVQAVAQFITAGLGVGVLPDHLVSKLLREKVGLYVFEGSGRPLKNAISLAQLKGRSQTPAARMVMSQLKEMLKGG